MMNKWLIALTLVFLYSSYSRLYGQVKALDYGKESPIKDSTKAHKDSLIGFRDIGFCKKDSLILIVRFQHEAKFYLYKLVSLPKLQQKLDELLNLEIQNGYLKASYHLDTLMIKKGSMIIQYKMNQGRHYKIDSIILHRSSASLNLNFIQNYLQKYYTNSKDLDWKEIADQIKYIDFIEMEKNPDFTIRDTSAIFNLYLKERKLNQINAIMGILSNAYNTNEVELTGDVKLAFVNLFKKGISFDLNWQKNLSNSQFLYSKFNLPFLFNTKLGSGGFFNIEKFDTTYLRLQYQLELNYHIHYNQIVSFFYRKNTSIIIGFNKQDVFSGKLPEHLDFTTDEFGFGYKLVKLNRPFFTKKGWSLETNFILGNKTTSINSKISELKDGNGNTLARLYDNIPLSQLTLSFLFDINKYSPLGGNFILKTRWDCKAWISETVSTGEKYYIGGNKLPRGFDDNNFIVPWYVNLSNELQYYLSEYFYSNIFVDMASIKNTFKNELVYPIGLGGGMALKTKDNILRVNIGTGYLGESKLSLGSLKVHINYVSVF